MRPGLGAILLFSGMLCTGAGRAGKSPVSAGLAACCNLRDLGGYPTGGGTAVKCGLFYRAGDLHALTPEETRLLGQLGLKTVVDFRAGPERARAADKLPPGIKRVCNLEIGPGEIPALPGGPINAEQFMLDAYRALAREQQRQYAEFFKLAEDPANTPLLFHCSAGKDRTGLAAALLLAALGADRQTIMRDYLLSAERVKEKYARYVAEFPEYGPLFTVKPEYLQAAWAVIETEFGGEAKYLKDCLHADVRRLRKLYCVCLPVKNISRAAWQAGFD